jgi:tetratricopeptide (TPR) repeat protein
MMIGPSVSSPSRSAGSTCLVSLVAAVSVLLLPVAGRAQTTGVVRGLIVDAQGQAVAGARVVATDQRDASNRIRAETSADGRFTYADIQSGFYVLTADKAELGGEAYRILVRSGRTVEVNFTLSPGRRGTVWPSDRREREALSDAFDAGVEASRDGDFERAVERFTQALALRPTCLECHFNLGVAYGELARLDESEAAFRASLVVDPNYAAAYYGLSALYSQQNRTEDAAEARSEATRIAITLLSAGRTEATNALSQGLAFLDADNLTDAEQRFRSAIDLDSTYGPAYYWLGMALIRQGRPDTAAEQFDYYLRFDPSGEHADEAWDQLQASRRSDPS